MYVYAYIYCPDYFFKKWFPPLPNFPNLPNFHSPPSKKEGHW